MNLQHFTTNGEYLSSDCPDSKEVLACEKPYHHGSEAQTFTPYILGITPNILLFTTNCHLFHDFHLPYCVISRPLSNILNCFPSSDTMHNPVATVIAPHETTGLVKIDLLIDLAKQGLPNSDPLIRLYLYELILHIRPVDRLKWDSASSARSTIYWNWVSQHFATAKDWLDRAFADEGVTERNFGLQDNETMAQIHGDLARTPTEQFTALHLGATDDEIRPHMRRIERLLYIFSCLNTAYSYTQGFDGLAFPLYYIAVSAHRQLGHSDDAGEASAFFLLQNLITGTGLGDLFTMEQDFDSVASKFDLIKEMAALADPPLADHLFTKLALTPLQFAFPWVSVMFHDLYTIDALLIVWDRFFLKESNIVEFGMAIAAAHLIEARVELLARKSFSDLLDFLHHIKGCDPAPIIARAEDMWARYITQQP
jgi:hypothetical protein